MISKQFKRMINSDPDTDQHQMNIKLRSKPDREDADKKFLFGTKRFFSTHN